jgi:hypothetical protein
MKHFKTIGRQDIIDLPDFDLSDVKAKIDTGAHTSSIHCTKVKVIDEVLHFTIPLGEKRKYEKENFETRKIRSSNGKAEHRYVIKTTITIFEKTYRINFSLSDRSKMKNPILLGTRFLKNKFVVDVSKKNLSYDLK